VILNALNDPGEPLFFPGAPAPSTRRCCATRGGSWKRLLVNAFKYDICPGLLTIGCD
jgi:hypothetical protein